MLLELGKSHFSWFYSSLPIFMPILNSIKSAVFVPRVVHFNVKMTVLVKWVGFVPFRMSFLVSIR